MDSNDIKLFIWFLHVDVRILPIRFAVLLFNNNNMKKIKTTNIGNI